MNDAQKKLIDDAGYAAVRAYVKAVQDVLDVRDKSVMLMQPLHYISRELVHGVLHMENLTPLQKKRAQIAYKAVGDASRALNAIFEDYDEDHAI